MHKHIPKHKHKQKYRHHHIVALHCNLPSRIHSQEHPKRRGKILKDALREAPGAHCCGWIDPSNCTHHECSHHQLTVSNALLLFTSPAQVLNRTSPSLGKVSGKYIPAKKVVAKSFALSCQAEVTFSHNGTRAVPGSQRRQTGLGGCRSDLQAEWLGAIRQQLGGKFWRNE